jgi:hypothetical protein
MNKLLQAFYVLNCLYPNCVVTKRKKPLPNSSPDGGVFSIGGAGEAPLCSTGSSTPQILHCASPQSLIQSINNSSYFSTDMNHPLNAFSSSLSSTLATLPKAAIPPYTTSHHIPSLPLSPLFFINRYFFLFYCELDDVFIPQYPLPPSIITNSNVTNFLHNNYPLNNLPNFNATPSTTTQSSSSTPNAPFVFTSADTSPECEMAMHPWLAGPLGVYSYITKEVVSVANEDIRKREREVEREKERQTILRKEKKEQELKLKKEKKKKEKKNQNNEDEVGKEEINTELSIQKSNTPHNDKDKGIDNDIVTSSVKHVPSSCNSVMYASSHHRPRIHNSFHLNVHYDYLLNCLFLFIFLFIFFFFVVCSQFQ